MCGIVFFQSRQPISNDLKVRLDNALEAISYRGPDARGVKISEVRREYFGHRRLSVVDLSSGGNQPMSRYGWSIVYNGEIYNYRELRAKLEQLGYSFSSRSDTEVLLTGWHHFREAFLDMIDGMFAFVIEKDGEVFAATDPFGEKPMFWSETDHGIIVASELRALAQVRDLVPTTERNELLDFFLLGYVTPPATGYKDVYRMPPASLMKIKGAEKLSVSRYWEPPSFLSDSASAGLPTKHELSRVKDALCVSLERRLLSDAPLCLFLSTGTDSTLIAGLCARELGVTPDALTFEIRGELTGTISIEEAKGASEIARELNLSHDVVSLDSSELEYEIDDILDLFGVVNDNTGALALKAICKTARKKSVVALTGVGGDELSFGYGKAITLYKMRMLYRMNEMLRRATWAGVGVMSAVSQRFKAISEHTCGSLNEVYLTEKNLPAMHAFSSRVNIEDWCQKRFQSSDLPPYYVAGMEDLVNTMPGTILFGQDHASMSESMELRSPFLSREVCNAMAEIGAERHIVGGRKYVFGQLRDQYLDRKRFPAFKHGFLYSSQDLISKAPKLEKNLLPEEFREVLELAYNLSFEGRGWTKFAIRALIYQSWIQRIASKQSQNRCAAV
ncbi:asparagine synthase (glutamine-hydrolyzing) [Thalassospira povalilytica]|uniref:asparagine synthase (glutamine-hydrolyzing) n=1 Tax=Thalassospira povalilytica TaxID=732237 RepID=UPI003AA814BB